MDTRHVEEFIEFSKSMNYRAAAKELYVAHTTLATHIAALEAEVGTPLIVKRPSGLVLTAAGKVFLTKAQRGLDWLEEFFDECRQAAEQVIPLRISSYSSSYFETILWDTSLSFHDKYPDKTVEVTIVPKLLQGAEALKHGDVDISLYTYFRSGPNICYPNLDPAYSHVYLYTDPTYLVIMEGNDLFAKETIFPQDLQGRHMLGLDGPGWDDFHQQVIALFSDAGVDMSFKPKRAESYYEYCYSSDPDDLKIINKPSLVRYDILSNPKFRCCEIEGLPIRSDRFAVYQTETFPEAALPFLDELRNRGNRMAIPD